MKQVRSKTEVTKELGISADTLYSWLKTAGVQSAKTEHRSSNAKRMRELEAKVRALRKQLNEKDEVIDVLKNSVGIL